MNMFFDSANLNRVTVQVFQGASHLGIDLIPNLLVVAYRSRTTDLPGYRTPLQGASSFDVYPGLKPLG